GVIKEIADKVLVMYKGSIVEKGSVDTLFSNPVHPYTKGLLACRPPIDRVLRKLPMMSDFIQLDEGKMISKNTDIEHLLHTLEEKPGDSTEVDQKDPVLQVKDLMVQYPGKTNFFGRVTNWTSAVNNIRFEVHGGEVLGLAGESGCGKSTLARALLQLIRPNSGAVRFNGANLCALSRKEMRKWRSNLQLIFQDPYSSLNPR